MSRRWLLALGFTVLWGWAGLGQSVLVNKCYESRHAQDRQPMVLPGIAGHVLMVAIWPLATAGNILDPPDCTTIKVIDVEPTSQD